MKAQSEELRVDDDAETVRPGSLVHVRSTIDEPEFGWGNVDGMSVGIVRDVSRGEVSRAFLSCTCSACLHSRGESTFINLDRRRTKSLSCVVPSPPRRSRWTSHRPLEAGAAS